MRYLVVLQFFTGVGRERKVLSHTNYYFNSIWEVREFFSFDYWSRRYDMPPWSKCCKYYVYNTYLRMEETYAFGS